MSNKFSEYYNKLMSSKYFSINDAITSPAKTTKVFIIANEKIKRNNTIGRYFTVFPNFQYFLAKRNKYPHCHEILVDHINNKPNLAGRLVFDFDIKYDTTMAVPKDFSAQIEDCIIEVVDRYFIDIDAHKFQFVWSKSDNPKKFSKHLTVNHLYFENWVSLSKIFYELFCMIWDEKYLWIESDKLIDSQIVRNNASLRMTGSSKINGYPLFLEDEKYNLTDSLIRIYSSDRKKMEQMVTMDNIRHGVLDSVLEVPKEKQKYIFKTPGQVVDAIHAREIYEKAFEIYGSLDPNTFKLGKINGSFLLLQRIRKNKCLLSKRVHENENAFLIINKDGKIFKIFFGCFRFCDSRRFVCIGMVKENLEIEVSFEK